MPVNTRHIRKALVLVAAVLALATVGDPTAEELEARRAKIAAMDPAQQQDLLRKLERFEALPEAEQQRLRELQAAIDADPNAERLLIVLERYHEWLKTITNSQRRCSPSWTPSSASERSPKSAANSATRSGWRRSLGRICATFAAGSMNWSISSARSSKPAFRAAIAIGTTGSPIRAPSTWPWYIACSVVRTIRTTHRR